MKFKNLIITNHARLRMNELNLSENLTKKTLRKARYYRINIFRDIYKVIKYGKRQHGVCYYHVKGSSSNPPLLFTVAHRKDKTLLLTVTARKI